MAVLWPTTHNTTHTVHHVISFEASLCSFVLMFRKSSFSFHHIIWIRNTGVPKGLPSSDGLLTAPCTVECPLSKSLTASLPSPTVHLAMWNVLIHGDTWTSWIYNPGTPFSNLHKKKSTPIQSTPFNSEFLVIWQVIGKMNVMSSDLFLSLNISSWCRYFIL